MSKRKGAKGADELERLVEAWLELEGWRVHRAAAVMVRLPGGKSFSRMHDIFGCFDFVAVRPKATDGHPNVWGIQTTVPDKRDARRDKVEAAGPWPPEVRATVLHHLSARLGRETAHYFMLEDLSAHGWSQLYRREVDVKAMLAHRKTRHAEKKTARAEKRRASLIRLKGIAARRERGLCNVTGCENPFLWGVAYMGTGAVVCDEHYQSDFGGAGGTKVEPAAASPAELTPLFGQVRVRSIDECPVDDCRAWVPGIDADEIHDGATFTCHKGHALEAAITIGGSVTLVRQEVDA